jgi:pyruvate,water dikinase
MTIVWLDDTGCQEVSRVGGKVAHLSRLAAEYQVPPGFCLTTSAFREWAGHEGGSAEEFPSELLRQLSDAYGELARRSDVERPSVAVRSSAIDEDGRFASFAGQYETYLNLEGDAAVAAAVLRCWHSTRTERVTEYRDRAGLADERLEMAVLVQELVPADSSAVIFSANPVTQNRDEVVINASWGLGESIVGGTVNPDTFTLDKRDLTVTESKISEKKVMTVRARDGTEEVPVPRFMRSHPTLSDDQLVAMARLAMRLEDEMGWPVDLESAYCGEELYLLQCRQITTLTELDQS